MALSKLHVRYIQTQNNFYITTDTITDQKISKEFLYIKNSNSFYLINNSDTITNDTKLTLKFKHANDFMQSFECQTDIILVEKNSEDFETALLFFNTNANKVKQLLLLTLI